MGQSLVRGQAYEKYGFIDFGREIDFTTAPVTKLVECKAIGASY